MEHREKRLVVRYFLGRRRSLGEGRAHLPCWATGGPAAVALGRRLTPAAAVHADILERSAVGSYATRVGSVSSCRRSCCIGGVGPSPGLSGAPAADRR